MKVDETIRTGVRVALRAVLPALLGALGAMVAVVAPIHFQTFCAGLA